MLQDEDNYPLVFPDRRRSRSFYYALGLVIPVAIVTPGCFGFTLYYIISLSLQPTRSTALHPAKLIFLIYSLVEIAFFFYLKVLGWRIQRPAKASEVDPEECMALFHRMMQSGLGDGGLAGGRTERGGGRDQREEEKVGEGMKNGKGNNDGYQTVQEVTGYNLQFRRTSGPATRSILSPIPQSPPRSDRLDPSSPVMPSPDASPPSNPLSSSTSIPAPHLDPTIPKPSDPSRLRQSSKDSLNVPQTLTTPPSRTSSPDVTVERLEPRDPRAVEFRERLRKWFDLVPFSTVTRTDILTWLCFACFNLPYESIATETDGNKKMEMVALLDKAVGLLEKRIGVRFGADGRQVDEGEDDGEKGFGRRGSRASARTRPAVVKQTRRTIEKESVEAVKIMRLTMDPVNCMTRPLLIYLFASLVNWWLKAIVYRKMGVRVYKQGDMEYLLRIPKDWRVGMGEEDRAPIVYLHGLGFGLLQNHFVINSLLTRMQTHPILIPLQPNISMDFFSHRHLHPLTRHETVEGIVRACERWGFWVSDTSSAGGSRDGSKADEAEKGGREEEESHTGGVVIMSHSNGSVTHTWILKDYPNFVRRSAFVDPVTFCLWEGSLCYNFCYRRPRTGMELLIYYYIASEIGIANTIQRHFDWAANSLFCEQIPDVANPEKNAFFLGGKDVIVDANRVHRYLHRHNIVAGVHMEPEAGHGEGLAGVALDRLIHWLATGRLDAKQFGEPKSSFVISAPDTPSRSAGRPGARLKHCSQEEAETLETAATDSDFPVVAPDSAQGGPSKPTVTLGPAVETRPNAVVPKLDPIVADPSAAPVELAGSIDAHASGSRTVRYTSLRFIAEQARRPGKVHLVLISTGSVASIKIPLIWRELIADGRFLVQIVATTPSLQFYDAEAIRTESDAAGHETDVWTDSDDVGSWKQKGDPILHIELRRWADLVFVVPCSANTIAKIAGGICDNLATSLLRALTPQTPTFIFPAMNTFMYQHPLTAKQLKIIQEEIGYRVVGPMGMKELACGDAGPGAMTEWKEVVQLARELAPDILLSTEGIQADENRIGP